MAFAGNESSISSLFGRIQDLVGPTVFKVVENPDDESQTVYKSILRRYMQEAIRDIVDRQLASNPKDMHLFTQNIIIKSMGKWGDLENEFEFGNHTIPWKDNDGGYFVDNNYILYVARQFGGISVPCHEVSAEKGLRVTDPDSIYFTGTDYRNPVFHRASSKIYVYPEVTIIDEGRASVVKFDSTFTMDDVEIAYFPNHLLYLAVIYVGGKALKLLLNQKRKEYEDDYSTPLKTWKALYGEEAIMPILPEFPTDLPDFGTGFNLDYLFPSIDFNEDGTETAETVQKIFSNMWNRIHEEEEVDLASAEGSRFTAIMNDYTKQLSTLEKRHQILLTEFTGKLTEFSGKFTTVMDVWAKYQASYAKSVELLTVEIQRMEAEYNKHFFPKHYQEKQKEEGSI